MSDWRLAARSRSGAVAQFRALNRTRLTLDCETLEGRQLLSTAATSTPNLSQITAQPNLVVQPMAVTGLTGLTPGAIRSAYGLPQVKFAGGTVGGYGAGQTIAIVTAYNDPNIAADLAAFDRQTGLPAPAALNVVNLGATTTDSGWALETALDVEWAHTMAPAAYIDLVEAPSASFSDLFNAVSVAKSLPNVSVVSMSWGTNEFYGEASYDSLFTTPAGHIGVTFVAASGDSVRGPARPTRRSRRTCWPSEAPRST